MGFKLPPVNTLRLFEAAARLNSFKQASEEVHITPSAVSHGIQTLEAWLGIELFERGPKGLSLSAAGKAYAPEIRRALSILAEATDRLPGRRATGELSICSMPTFAKRWLLPRLASFSESYPDITVTIDTARRDAEFHSDGIDVAIRRSDMPRTGEIWIHLMSESLVPVCSPRLREESAIEDDVEFILSSTLVHVMPADPDWHPWFAAMGITSPSQPAVFEVDTFQFASEAAIQGLGVALGRKPLVDEYLASGQLIELAGPPVPAAEGYWLVGSPLSFERPEVKLFKRWLIDGISNPGVKPQPRRYLAPKRGRRSSTAEQSSPESDPVSLDRAERGVQASGGRSSLPNSDLRVAG